MKETLVGNGWSLLAKMEALIGMEELGMTSDPDYQTLLRQFVDHSLGLQQVQSLETGQLSKSKTNYSGMNEVNQSMLTGLWPNILTNSSTFSETSASGMFLTALITGMERGWLERAEFEQTVSYVQI